MTEAEARHLRKLEQENTELKQLAAWYRAREHQQYRDDVNPDWLHQVRARQHARDRANTHAVLRVA